MHDEQEHERVPDNPMTNLMLIACIAILIGLVGMAGPAYP